MPTPVSVLLAKMASIFSKADPNQIQDLNDSLESMSDSTAVKDLWNAGNHRVPTAGEIVPGPGESMAGGNAGLDKMIADYLSGGDAAVSRNDSSPAACFAEMITRQTSIEKCLKALMGHVFKASDADDEEGSEEDDREEKDEDVSKGNIAKMGVEDLFGFLTKRMTAKGEAAARKAEKAERGVATPPSMIQSAPFMKSAYDILDEDDSMTLAERLNVRIKLNAQRLKAEGMTGIDNHDARYTGAGASITGMMGRNS